MWIYISKEKIFTMFPQDRKYDTAFQMEKAGAQKGTTMVLLCTSLSVFVLYSLNPPVPRCL